VLCYSWLQPLLHSPNGFCSLAKWVVRRFKMSALGLGRGLVERLWPNRFWRTSQAFGNLHTVKYALPYANRIKKSLYALIHGGDAELLSEGLN